MKKFLIAGALLAGLSAPALAQSLSIGGGFQNGASQTGNAAASIGNAAAAAASAANNTSIGAGFAATSPAGNVTSGVWRLRREPCLSLWVLPRDRARAQPRHPALALRVGAGIGVGFAQ